MKSTDPDIWNKLQRAEKRLAALSQEFQSLESEKRGYLQEIVKGGKLFKEIREADGLIKQKSRAISRAKEKVGNLRALLEGQLAQLKKDLIEEKQRELHSYMEQRTRYLKRIEELEVEISKYRYLVSGKKDHCLANVKDLLPSEIKHKGNFVPLEEVIGHLKLEIHKIIRMSSEALLKEYLAREKKGNRSRKKPQPIH